MKLTPYIAMILILSLTLVCLVSAVGISDQSNPGQNGMRPTPTPNQYAPGGSQPQPSQYPGTGGREITRQPSYQPTQQLNEPGRYQAGPSPSGFPGTYQNIPFPQTYPRMQPDYAAIQVTSNPVWASVYLDGSYQGTTPSSGYLDISDLSPGTFTIRLTSSGYTDYSTEITLSRNEVATISADLTKAYDPSAYGALSLQSNPSGADVYLDNEYKGVSPLTLQGVAIGSHSVLIKKGGYSEYSGDVHIVSDQASGLSVTLAGIVTQAPTLVPTLPPAPAAPPAPMPTKSPLSPWAAVCGLALAGLGYAVRRNHP